MKGRTLVIGDIHGGLKALKQVLRHAEVTVEDQLIFLGDYVDGWSESPQTIDHLIELNAQQPCTFIRGNHDDLCYQWLSGAQGNPMWLHHGGAATVKAYETYGSGDRAKHLDFFERMVNYRIDSENRLFVHAGFTNMHGILHEYFSEMFYWDRTLWEMALALEQLDSQQLIGTPVDVKRLRHYKEIYIGHTPLTHIGETRPYKALNVWNMDTGAAFRGSLSLMDINSKEVWQSDPVHRHYPTEKGRN